jgi:outer membrane protein insertion porin family
MLISLAGSLLGSTSAQALDLAQLDPKKSYKVDHLEFKGNQVFSDSDLTSKLSTKERPAYFFWKARPEFDPAGFDEDLKRINQLYENEGYYHTQITYDLDVKNDLVTAKIFVNEDGQVHVASLDIYVDHDRLPDDDPLYARLPLKPGAPFTQEQYEAGEQTIHEIYLDASYAHAHVQRRAEVDPDHQSVRIVYTAQPGAQAVFGETRVEGADKVNPDVVLDELSYKFGERYSLKEVQKTRDKILKLNLFSVVQIAPADEPPTVRRVRMVIRVREKPPRSVRISAGYSTQNEFGGQFEWHHYNWLGGARHLSLLGRYSNILSSAAATFVQPHFLDLKNDGSLAVRFDQDDEDPFLLTAERFVPRLDHHFTDELSAFINFRAEYDQLNHLAPETIKALKRIRRKGILAGPTLGLNWNSTDDPFNPTKGHVVTFSVDQAQKIFGSDYRFYKFTAEDKNYNSIPLGFILATRAKIGTGDSIGPKHDFPVFERFFSGGEGSVRGYGRWELGPRSLCPPPPAPPLLPIPPGILPPGTLPPPLGPPPPSNQPNNPQTNLFKSQKKCNVPIGGLSVVEGSVELRHQIYKALSGAIFLDAGAVSLRPYDPPFGKLRYGYGPALMIGTPVGPVRVDIGFPSKAPLRQPHWQLYFSIGQFF